MCDSSNTPWRMASSSRAVVREPSPRSTGLRQWRRGPPGPELSDLVTSRLPRGCPGQGGASSRGRFCRMSDVLGDKAEGVTIRFLARSGIQSPRQHHPRRPGERRGPKRSGDGVVRVEATAASRLGGRAGRRRRSASGHRASSRRVRRAGSLPATPSRCPAEPSMGVLGDGA